MLHHVPTPRRDDVPDAIAEYTETTRRQYETARLIATRRYWRRAKVRSPFVPPTDEMTATGSP